MKPDERKEQLVAEFEKTNEELRVLKARAQRIHQKLCELKNGEKDRAVEDFLQASDIEQQTACGAAEEIIAGAFVEIALRG